MKKILATLFASTILCTLLCSCGEPASSPIEDFTYEFDNGNTTITGYIGSDLEVVIPSVIEKRPVTVIGKKAFEGYDMTSVVIPESVIELEREAFDWCEQLDSITFLGTLQIVGEDAFNETTWFNNQPEGVIYLNNSLIDYKGNPTSHSTSKDHTVQIYVEEGTKSIVDRALYDSAIRYVHIPESVEYIGEDALYKEFVTIYGKIGSAAETYALENNLTFVEE